MDYSLVASDEKSNGEASSEEFVPPVSIWKKIKHKKRKIKTEQIVGIFEVFRFLDRVDTFLMSLGTICAALSGLGIPGLFVIVGDVAEHFIKVGSFENLLNSIDDYFQFINKTKEEVLANPSLLDALQDYYGNEEKCLESTMHEGIFDIMAELALFISGLGLMVFVTQYIHITCWILTAERRAHRIRRACLLNVLRQDIGWFDTHETAQLNYKLSEDIRKIQDGTGEKVGIFIQWSMSALACITIGLLYGWKLALVLLISTPVMIFTTVLYGKVAAAVSSKEQKAYLKAGAIAEEALGAIRTVVAFGGQEKEAQRYKRNLQTAQKYGIKKGLVNGLSQGLNWLIVYCFIALGFWYGAKLTREEEDYDISNVAIVVSLIMNFAHALGMAAPSIPAFATARCAAHTIFELIDRKSEIDSLSEDGLKPKSVTGTIKFETVHFSYPARPDVEVLNGLNLEAKQGQTVALVGSSGCGKSTLVQLVLRFYDPHKGKILIDGQDIKTLNVKWLRTVVGVVSQEPVLFGTTITENIRYGREDVTMKEIEEATKTANAYDFILSLPDKFETVVGEQGSQLSGGQKQRLAIARALVRNPKILLLDEATSALDTESESIVQDALDKSRKGRTTLVVAHRLSTIKNADLVVGLDEGKVAEIGSHEELMEKQGIYYQLVMNQQTSTLKEDELSEDINSKEKLKDETLKSAKESLSPQNEAEEEVHEDLPKAPLMRLIKLAAPDWPIVAMGLSGSIANGCVAPIFAVTMTRILSVFAYLDANEQEEKIRKNVLIVVGIGLFSLVACFLQGYAFGRAGEALTKRLRDLSFRSILKQGIAFFDDNKNNVGALTTKLATDASLVHGIGGPRLGAFLMTLVNITTSLFVAFYHGWKLTLVVLAFLPFMIITGVTVVKLMAGQAGENKKALEGAGKITVESVGNIRTVASLTIEQTFLNKYMEQLEKPHRDVLKKSHLLGILFGLGLSIMFFAYAATFLYGAYLMEEGEMKFDDVFTVFYAVIIGSLILGQATAFVPDLGKAQISARRIFQLLDLQSAIDYTSAHGTRLEAVYNADVTFKDVEFHYPNRKSVKVLQGMTFTVSPGQTVALVGSSGCGKSTSVQLIERFYDCDAGQVTLDNHNVKTLNVKWLREQIGIVSQEPVLFNTSIAENIAYGDNTRIVNMNEIITAARSSNIHSFIASLPDGYDTIVGLRGAQLSGGQKQRIAIARALVRNPKILLLDEATSALDTENEKVVQEALDTAREGRTCVVVAHRLSTVQNADNICVISDGKVTEIGTHSELMTKQGFYYKLVKNSIKES